MSGPSCTKRLEDLYIRCARDLRSYDDSIRVCNLSRFLASCESFYTTIAVTAVACATCTLRVWDKAHFARLSCRDCPRFLLCI